MEIETRTDYSECIFEYKPGRMTPGTSYDTEKTFLGCHVVIISTCDNSN